MSWNRRVWTTASAIAAVVFASASLDAQSVVFGSTFVPLGLTAGPMAARPIEQAVRIIDSPTFEDVVAALGECAPCKANSRPFFIPPGWIFRTMLAQVGDNHGNSAAAPGGFGNSGGQGSQRNGVAFGIGTGNASSNEGGASLNAPVGTTQTAAAIDLDVSVTPEPASLALVATALFAISATSRRRRRS